jgi:hypothetical protein
MQKLLEPNTVPPDGFRYFQAETKTWIRASDYANLFLNVRDHRKANNLPLGTFWEAEVEDQLCRSLPPGLCKESRPGEGKNVFTRIGWDEVVAGTTTIVNWMAGGLQKVDQALADKRAAICSTCYFNVQVGGLCAACQHLQNLAAKFTGGQRTASDFYLKACAVCKCSLQVKVWTPIEAIDKGTPEDMLVKFPQFCWIPSELSQHRKDAKS